MAFPQGRLHALHRCGLREGLPQRGAVPHRIQYRFDYPGPVHRLQGVHLCLSFQHPRYDRATDKVYKCDLCHSRLQADLIPACAKACPTGAITFGDKSDMLNKAYARVRDLGGDASVYGDKFVGGTHVVYVLQEKPEVYERLPVKPSVSSEYYRLEGYPEALSLVAAGA